MQSYSDYGNIIFSRQWIEKWMHENCRSGVLIRCVGQAQNIGSNTNLVGGNKVHGIVNGTTGRRQNMIKIQNCASAEGIVRQIDCNLKSFVVVCWSHRFCRINHLDSKCLYLLEMGNCQVWQWNHHLPKASHGCEALKKKKIQIWILRLKHE